jgi:hypothetical protein
MLFRRKTLEEPEQEAQREEQLRLEAEQQRLAEELEEACEAFFESPPGQTRTAFERGDLPGLRTEDGIADIGFAWAAWIIDPGPNALGILQLKE